VSGLWTPGGDPPAHDDGPGVGPGGVPDLGAGPQLSPEEEAEAREQLRQIREQLANTPVADIVANHVIGLWELAILHLTGPDEAAGPNLREAGIAIDAVAALVEGLGDRLGQNAEPLREALAQLRLAYVEASRGPSAEEN
jgi:hypothetical protein